MAKSSGLFLWVTVPTTGETLEKSAEEATSLLLAGDLDGTMPSRLAGDERVAGLSNLLAWLDSVHASRLDLSGSVDTESVRSSFRVLSRQYHPDQTATLGPELQKLAERRFKEIGESKSYLLARLGAGLDSIPIHPDAREPRISPPPPSLVRASPTDSVAPAEGSADSNQKLARRPARRTRETGGAGLLGPFAALVGLGAALFWWLDPPQAPAPEAENSAIDPETPPVAGPALRVVDYSELVKTDPEARTKGEGSPSTKDEPTPSQQAAASSDREPASDPPAPTSAAPASTPAPVASDPGSTTVAAETKPTPDRVPGSGETNPPLNPARPDAPDSNEAAIEAASDPAVAAILEEYQNAARIAADDEFDRRLALLNTQYSAALKKAEAEAGAQGLLENVIAIRKEEESVRSTGGALAEPSDLPDSVAGLRRTYLSERSNLEQARHRDLAGPREAAVEKLEARVVSATREGSLAMALAIRELIADLGAEQPKANESRPTAEPTLERREHPGFGVVTTTLRDQRMTRALFVFDIDQNESPDILCLGAGVRSDALYMNANWPRFGKSNLVGEASVPNLSQRRGAGWGRIDATRGVDFLAAGSGLAPVLLRGDSLGKFTDQTGASGLAAAGPTRMACWGDMNGDGNLDLVIVTTAGNAGDVVSLWLNRGDGTFSKSDIAPGLLPSGNIDDVGFLDIDLDGDLDLLASGTFGFQLLENEGRAIFRNTTRERGLGGVDAGIGAWADSNHDGSLEVVFAGGSGSPMRFFAQEVGGVFREDPWTPEGEAIGLAWIDLDADGWLDLFVAGWGGRPSRIHRNLGGGGFGPAESPAGLEHPASAYGVAVADLDRDGDEDLVLADWGANAVVLENRINPPRNSFLRVRPGASREVPNGHGAVVRLIRESDGALVGLRLVDAGSATLQSPQEVVFHGLAGSCTVEVSFPGGGTVRRTGVVPDGKTLEITP